jgi:hypothetical protein
MQTARFKPAVARESSSDSGVHANGNLTIGVDMMSHIICIVAVRDETIGCVGLVQRDTTSMRRSRRGRRIKSLDNLIERVYIVIVQPQGETEARWKGTRNAIWSWWPLDLSEFTTRDWSSKGRSLQDVVLIRWASISDPPGLICPPLLPLYRIRTNGRAIHRTDNRLNSIANNNSQSRRQSWRE